MAATSFVFKLLFHTFLANSWVITNGFYDPDLKMPSLRNIESTKTDEGDLAPRVVGGTVMLKNSHPFLALILFMNEPTCGGSIISSTFILTAAHCNPKKFSEYTSYYTIYLGVHDRLRVSHERGERFQVKRIIKHEEFKELEGSILINDIALMEVDQINFNKYIRPICIPLQLDVSKYDTGIVAGWGSTTEAQGPASEVPKQATLTILTTEQCKRTAVNSALSAVPNIYNKVFCAYRRNSDSCTGDSGGPLYALSNTQRVVQTGIVSFGVGCGIEGYPGLYTKITNYLDWLKTHVKTFGCSV